jgi:UDP-N-acetylglucosamine--N-acetylmuramyl-(pentapeptide) pyrophosphoryl-undecaprenol N-acetylglucosamine transferase
VLGGALRVGAGGAWRRWTLRLPVVLTEADSHLGLSNRALAPFARRVCLAFPSTAAAAALSRDRAAVPASSADRASARERSGFPQAQCVLVFGGSLGSRSINAAAVEASRGAASTSCTYAGGATTASSRHAAAAR